MCRLGEKILTWIAIVLSRAKKISKKLDFGSLDLS